MRPTSGNPPPRSKLNLLRERLRRLDACQLATVPGASLAPVKSIADCTASCNNCTVRTILPPTYQ
jgi:hypothetical protein